MEGSKNKMEGNMMKLEVITIMAHLIITLFLIAGYLYTLIVLNAPDETLKMAIMTILGYWFGAIGMGRKKEKEGVKKNESV